MNIPLIINVLGFVALLILLAKLGAKGWSLSKKVLVGLVFGVAYRVICRRCRKETRATGRKARQIRLCRQPLPGRGAG